METEKKLISNRILELVQSTPLPQNRVIEAALYSLSTPGKYLRPIFTLLTSEMFGANIQDALDPACAIELIHTYSLIHDDLPAIDDDDLRRGKETVHIKYDEATAILAGDFLLTYAFEILAGAPHLDAEKKCRLTQTLAKRAGARGMIGGQMIDIQAAGTDLSESLLLSMHELKTAALFTAALEFGAIVGGANDKELQLISKFGRDFGISFQIIDDLLDVTASTEVLGKSQGSDDKNNKPTSVTILGEKRAREVATLLNIRAFSHLNQLTCDTSKLKKLTKTLLNRRF